MLWYKLGGENNTLGLFGSLYIDSLAINLGENKGSLQLQTLQVSCHC